MEKKKAPMWLRHKPIVTVDYEQNDAIAGDAKFLSLGKANWNSEDYSAKIWRWAEKGDRWSRQSEEMPLWRVLDLATLLVATINKKTSYLGEYIQDSDSIDGLNAYLAENMELLAPRLNELSKLLSANSSNEMSFDSPNIFNFATSELSHDALFAWLIQWADSKYKSKCNSLHSIAQDFVRLLIGDDNYAIETIKVGRQWKSIDVWVEINDDAFLVIEDKTNTSIHDKQLERYKAIVEKEYNGRTSLFYAYVKTGNEPKSILEYIQGVGYKTISRKEIIQCFEKYEGNDTIICSYLKYLKVIEEKTQSFGKLSVDEWGGYAWQGFYKELESKLDLTSWGYVSNHSGGFLGAWWHGTAIRDGEVKIGEMYLQFEEKKLCFKIYYEGKDRSNFRDKQYRKLIETAEKFNCGEITRPAQFGDGYTMTIATVAPKDVFGTGIIDIDELVKKLQTYQSIIDTCCSNENF